MIEQQPKLLKDPGNQQISKGPVFEFGPGWNVKTKKWFKKYILGGTCTLCRATRYVLLFGIIILLFGGAPWKQSADTPAKDSLKGQATIAEAVQGGDSRIKLARRALSDYLVRFPGPILSGGQKIYIETTLAQKVVSGALTVGTKIEFLVEDLKLAIEKSKSLTSSQLRRWEAAAKSVKF